jgi:hypothetical protein
MSFPFVQPYFGLGNSLQTAQAGGAAAAGGWVELGRTTLGSSGDIITVSSLDDKRYYMILGYGLDTGGTIGMNPRLNGDTGSNYASRQSQNGGSDNTQTSSAQGRWADTNASDHFGVLYLSNLSSKEKLMIAHSNQQSGAGAGTAPARFEAVSKWANTSNAVNSFTMQNFGTGSYDTNSEVVILGWDPSDSHTTNFWEELASVELGGAGDNLSSGTISARKYLWVQAWFKNGGGTNRILPGMRFNNDSGSNYAYRRSIDGGTDGTSTNLTNLHALGTDLSGANQFYNFFIINNSANEKLAIFHALDMQPGTGAGNAPRRSESVGKWANTSAQITEVEFDNLDSGDFGTGSIIKVWGSD